MILLSTYKAINGYSGFLIYQINSRMYFGWRTGLSGFRVTATSLVPNTWYHIAFAYQNTLGTPSYEIYINFEAVPVTINIMPSETEFAINRFMGSGYTAGFGLTGFGIIDELLVFPKYLSASEIAQLEDSSN